MLTARNPSLFLNTIYKWIYLASRLRYLHFVFSILTVIYALMQLIYFLSNFADLGVLKYASSNLIIVSTCAGNLAYFLTINTIEQYIKKCPKCFAINAKILRDFSTKKIIKADTKKMNVIALALFFLIIVNIVLKIYYFHLDNDKRVLGLLMIHDYFPKESLTAIISQISNDIISFYLTAVSMITIMLGYIYVIFHIKLQDILLYNFIENCKARLETRYQNAKYVTKCLKGIAQKHIEGNRIKTELLKKTAFLLLLSNILIVAIGGAAIFNTFLPTSHRNEIISDFVTVSLTIMLGCEIGDETDSSVCHTITFQDKNALF